MPYIDYALRVAGQEPLGRVELPDLPVFPGWPVTSCDVGRGWDVAELVGRLFGIVAPTVTAYLVPCVHHGTAEKGGAFWHEVGVALVSARSSANDVVSFALHEAWHAVERHLLPSENAVLQAELDTGASWGSPDYLDTLSERGARAFSAFGMLVLAGVRVPLVSGTSVEVFNRAWQGVVGRRTFQPTFGRRTQMLASFRFCRKR